MAVAFCFANGVIRIGETCPDGALPIAVDEPLRLQEVINGLATMAWDNTIMLIPNFGLAGDDCGRVDAVLAFSERVNECLR